MSGHSYEGRGKAGKPHPLHRHARACPTAVRLQPASSAPSTVMVGAGRPSTSLPATGRVFLLPSDWPHVLWLQTKKIQHGGRGHHRDHGEERPLTPHSNFSVHL